MLTWWRGWHNLRMSPLAWRRGPVTFIFVWYYAGDAGDADAAIVSA